jgi:diketogulonate reductase-like aldo/keto reductase
MAELKFPKFTVSEKSKDPKIVPKKKLPSGAEIPAIGLGTFGSDHVSASEIAQAVFGAAQVGYRHFDCAAVYGNEHEIGIAFNAIINGGIKREDLWITSKVWNDMHEQVIDACKKTLNDLQLEYLDLYLVHWPFPNHHPKGAPPDYHNPDAKPYIHENYMKTWRQMEKLVEMGLVKHIGTSNMTIPKLKLVLKDAKIRPVVNQLELHPHFQQPELFKFLIDNKIMPVGFSPIGSPARPARDKTPEDTVPTDDPVIVKIAKRLNVHPAVVCVKWAIQSGQIPIPFSTNHYLQNLQGIVSPPLTDSDMAAITKIDKNCRLIKGQVFLWRENQRWEDLWDLDGTIPS